MIDDLKKNIDTEIEILEEIAIYNSRIGLASETQKRMLNETIKSLMKNIKILNSSVPRILREISMVQRISAENNDSGLENLSFQREDSRVDVTLQIKDRDKFLEGLSISEGLIKRIRGREKLFAKDKEKFQEFKAARGYLKLSNKFFFDRAGKLIDKGMFDSLSVEMGKANIDVLFKAYVAMILFTSFISIFIGIFLTVFLLFFSIGFEFPYISIFSGNYFLRFAKIFWIPIALPVIVFLFLYFYPSTEKKTLARKIDQELPFAVIHMSAISGSGIEPSEIFRIIGLSREYPYLRREIRKLLNQLNLYGYDLTTALRNVAKSTPSVKLAELFSGLSTTINSGGSLKNFFNKRAETLLADYRIERERYTKTAETFMDIYISVVIAAPMILMLLFVMIAVSGISAGFSTGAITVLIVGIIAVINVVFLAFLNVKQPTY